MAPVNGTALAIVGSVYSPVALARDWPTMGRIIFVVSCSCIGTIMNGFFISTFLIERTLRKSGNAFLACLGLADLFITTGVFPASSVVLLSGQWDTADVCYALHFLAVSSTYTYNICFMMVSIENYLRICTSSRTYEKFLNMKTAILAVAIFIISFVTAGVGVYLQYEYDYCARGHVGNFTFRAATAVVFQIVPFMITMFGFVSASVAVKRRARKQIKYRRSLEFEFDNSLLTLNITEYLLFVITWTPYLIVVYQFPDTTNITYYHCVWFGLIRSAFSTSVYAFGNRTFRQAFADLFNYCFCKVSLSTSHYNRHRRPLEYRASLREIRVHIMHQGFSTYTPARYSCSSRETQMW